MRNAEIKRDTAETKISLWLDLDGTGKSVIDTGVGFMDHMLTLLAKHARFDLMVKCDGDTYVDDHHSVEDIGISLGRAFADAIGDKRGIRRYGSVILPMDEALILAAVDISGRSYLGYELEIPTDKVGSFDTELVEEFMLGFSRNAGINLHLRQMAGRNSHHIIEGAFKALARALREAVSIDEKFKNDIPSTKGSLSEEKDEEFLTEVESDYMEEFMSDEPADEASSEENVPGGAEDDTADDADGADGSDVADETPEDSEDTAEAEFENEYEAYKAYRDRSDEDVEYFDDDYDGQEVQEHDGYEGIDEYDEAYEEAFDGAGYEEPEEYSKNTYVRPHTGLDDHYYMGINHSDTAPLDGVSGLVDELEEGLREKGLL